jgi:hypothetical protein
MYKEIKTHQDKWNLIPLSVIYINLSHMIGSILLYTAINAYPEC